MKFKFLNPSFLKDFEMFFYSNVQQSLKIPFQFSYAHNITLILEKHFYKLIVIQFSISILISLSHELIQLLLGEHGPQHAPNLLQLLHADKAILVTVKDLECLSQICLFISFTSFLFHHAYKLFKLYCAVTISIHLHYKVKQFIFSRVLTHRSQNTKQLLSRDGAATIRIKLIKCFFELCIPELIHIPAGFPHNDV